MKPNELITLETLDLMHACEEQRADFAVIWPDGAELTVENLEKAMTLGLDVPWFIRAVSPLGFFEYGRSVVAAEAYYEHVVSPAFEEYKRANRAALDQYRRNRALVPSDTRPSELEACIAIHRTARDVAFEMADKAYNAVRDQADRDFRRTLAEAAYKALTRED